MSEVEKKINKLYHKKRYTVTKQETLPNGYIDAHHRHLVMMMYMHVLHIDDALSSGQSHSFINGLLKYTGSL